jgi:hypothetical protein
LLQPASSFQQVFSGNLQQAKLVQDPRCTIRVRHGVCQRERILESSLRLVPLPGTPLDHALEPEPPHQEDPPIVSPRLLDSFLYQRSGAPLIANFDQRLCQHLSLVVPQLERFPKRLEASDSSSRSPTPQILLRQERLHLRPSALLPGSLVDGVGRIQVGGNVVPATSGQSE